MLGERLHHGRPLADGAEHGLPLDVRMVLLKLKIDRVEIEFAAVDQHELAWAERGDLAHQLRSEEHTSELQSLMRISYAVFCLKTKKNNIKIEELNKVTTQ